MFIKIVLRYLLFLYFSIFKLTQNELRVLLNFRAKGFTNMKMYVYK
jgi:hypothetical protein